MNSHVAEPDLTEPRARDACHIRPADIERVLKVAGELFGREGFDGVGIRQIAHESGVKMPSIFYHFGSKASLYEEVLEYQYGATWQMVSDAVKALNSPREKLECLIGSFFDLLLHDRTFSLLLHRDIVDVVSHKYRPAFIKVYTDVFSIFWKLLREAVDRPVEKTLAFSLVSLILGYCELTAVMDESSPPDADVEATKSRRDAWYAGQRTVLIDVGKRMCLI